MEEMEGLDVTECTKCPNLVESRSQIVNGDGPSDAALLFVGEAPGAKEDEEGTPFVGRSGSVLDDALHEVGLGRENIRITNCVRCRPPENRNPKKAELANCRTYLEREVDLVDPDVVVTLGKVPSEHVLDRNVAVTNESGTVERIELGEIERNVLVCLHPAATLYDSSQTDTFEETIAKAASMATGEDE